MTRIVTIDMAPTLSRLLSLVRDMEAREVDYDARTLPTYGGEDPEDSAAYSWDETSILTRRVRKWAIEARA